MVCTELHLELRVSAHNVNSLKQRTRENAGPLLSLDCLSSLCSVPSFGTLPPEVKEHSRCFSDEGNTSVDR